MKKPFLSSAALLALSVGALAADFPVRTAPSAPITPVFTWTGFYAGVNVGFGWANSGEFTTDSLTVPGNPGLGCLTCDT
jgi:outer membrane immunogenic protein